MIRMSVISYFCYFEYYKQIPPPSSTTSAHVWYSNTLGGGLHHCSLVHKTAINVLSSAFVLTWTFDLCLKFYRCFKAFLNCSTPERGSTVKTFTRISLRAVRKHEQQKVSAPAASTACPTPNSIHDSSRKSGHSASSNSAAAAANTPAANSSKPKLILVAHYRE